VPHRAERVEREAGRAVERHRRVDEERAVGETHHRRARSDFDAERALRAR